MPATEQWLQAKSLDSSYSLRNASSGSVAAARRAGIQAAMRAAAARVAVTAVRMERSKERPKTVTACVLQKHGRSRR